MSCAVPSLARSWRGSLQGRILSGTGHLSAHYLTPCKWKATDAQPAGSPLSLKIPALLASLDAEPCRASAVLQGRPPVCMSRTSACWPEHLSGPLCLPLVRLQGQCCMIRSPTCVHGLCAPGVPLQSAALRSPNLWAGFAGCIVQVLPLSVCRVSAVQPAPARLSTRTSTTSLSSGRRRAQRATRLGTPSRTTLSRARR